ncbi:MAG: helix-turn-helix domain-containing protein [Nocardioidaceae bacterium]
MRRTPAPSTSLQRETSTGQPFGLYTIDQAATYLGVPRGWVEAKARERAIPHTRIGKHVRFTIEHLQQIVKAGEQPIFLQPLRRGTARSRL